MKLIYIRQATCSSYILAINVLRGVCEKGHIEGLVIRTLLLLTHVWKQGGRPNACRARMSDERYTGVEQII